MSSLRRIALLYPVGLHADGTGRAALDLLRARHPRIEFRRAEFVATGAPASGEVRAAIAAADAVVCWELPSPLLQLAPKLRWIQTVSAGVDGLPVHGLRQAGIKMSRASGAAAPEIAEFVMARILEHYKRLPEIAESSSSHTWRGLYGSGLQNARLGLLGFGAINRRVARLADAFGMEVRVCRHTSSEPADGAVRTYGFGELPVMLAQCDVVACAVPETPETVGLLGQHAFEAMPAGAFFVNVGRGSAVQSHALLAALDSEQVSAAALDVFVIEPLPAEDPLWRHPRVRISAHCSSVPRISIERVIDLVSENIRNFDAGQTLINEV